MSGTRALQGGTFVAPDDAPCVTHHDPDLWHEQGREHYAKALCNPCPARAACLEFALRTRQTMGVWGATDPDERRALRKGAA